jgi:iron complex transport system substrate-binding protein
VAPPVVRPAEAVPASAPAASVPAPKHAKLFSIERIDGYTVLRNRIPWGGSSEKAAWVLTRDPKVPLPKSLAGLPRIRYPAKRIVALTIPAVSALSLLGCPDRVVGIGGRRFLYDPGPDLAQAVEVGPEGGMGPDADLERIASLAPDLVLVYVYTPQEREAARRLESMGVPVVFLSEYLEEEPLGVAEWLRFIGALVGKEPQARRICDRVFVSYEVARTRARAEKARPKVMTGAPFQGSWFVAGRGSWLARLVADAGGAYLWADLPGRGSVPVAPESVFARASGADVWVNCGLWRSLAEIRRSDPRLALFRPYKEGRIFNNDARSRVGGGNDYYESGPWRPDLILGDLASLLHPERFPGHRFTYFRRLPAESRSRTGTKP